MLKIGQYWGKMANYSPNAQKRFAPLTLPFSKARKWPGALSNSKKTGQLHVLFFFFPQDRTHHQTMCGNSLTHMVLTKQFNEQLSI